MKKNPLLHLIWALLIVLGAHSLSAQCPGDVIPPTPICINSLTLDLAPSGGMLFATDINFASFDNCTDVSLLQFRIEEGTPSSTPPAALSLSFTAAQAGAHTILMWVIDEAGNADYCVSTVNVTVCQSSPILVCNDQVSVQLGANGSATVDAFDILEGGPYCSYDDFWVDLDLGTPAASITVGPADAGNHIMRVTKMTGVGAGNACWGQLLVIADCVNDLTPPVAVGDASPQVELDTALNASISLPASFFNENSYDNCTPTNQLLLQIRELDNNFQPISPLADSMTFDQSDFGLHYILLMVTDLAGNSNFVVSELSILNPYPAHTLSGYVFADADGDCSFLVGQEQGLAGWKVVAIGQGNGSRFEALTNNAGHYAMNLNPTEPGYNVSLAAPFNYGGAACNTTYSVQYTPGQTENQEIDLSVRLNNQCPLLFVDLATPKIRPCFPGVYYVMYTNGSTGTISNTYIDVSLDPALAFQSATLPATALGNQQYRFQTGDLASGASGIFSINFLTDCNVPLGAAHCSEAHIYPDTLCPQSANWTGANVEVEGHCVQDSIFLKVKNTGSGPNAGNLGFVIVEDVLMYNSGDFNLPAGGELNLAPIMGNGATYRLQAEQEPGHPYGGMPSVSIEGCAGFNPGFVTLFPNNNANPFIAVDCRENTNSFDPNDKQALPKGIGNEHWIEPSTRLNYQIRFQNTGTDVAYTVVVLDTLSALLDASQIQTGASSHPYRFELLDGQIARFSFDNINLPDSTSNLANSQGFVQFSVPLVAGIAENEVVENTAYIYFDSNAPVMTNNVWHTIHSELTTASFDAPQTSSMKVICYPNPATDWVYFESTQDDIGLVDFTLSDAQGRVVQQVSKRSFPIALHCKALPPGLYAFQIRDQSGKNLSSGKLVVK